MQQVEAATADEAGKGFAVVAGEVRNLANRSAEVAKEMIVNINKKVALIEKIKTGQYLPNRACVPSKLLIGYAHVARTIKEFKRHFINASIQNIKEKELFNSFSFYIKSLCPQKLELGACSVLYILWNKLRLYMYSLSLLIIT